MHEQPVTRRETIGALLGVAGLTGCAALPSAESLEASDVVLRNLDSESHTISLRVTDAEGSVVFDDTANVEPKAADTTRDHVFPGAGDYTAVASFDGGEPRSADWHVTDDEPSRGYHVTVHGGEAEPYLTIGRVG